MIAAGIASAKIHLSNELATMQSDIQNLLVYFATGAADLGLPVISQKKSPIQYILVGSHEDALCVARRVMDNGFLVNCCAYPAVRRVVVALIVSTLAFGIQQGSVVASISCL